MATIPSDLGRRGFALKPLHIIGIAIILLAVVLGYTGLQQAVRPYTTNIKEAISSNRGVQLKGFPGGKGRYDANGMFTFDLQDGTGKLMKVVYAKTKPANFDDAINLVVIGQYDSTKSVFVADEMLVQCPSKYQEMDKAKT